MAIPTAYIGIAKVKLDFVLLGSIVSDDCPLCICDGEF